MWCTQCPRAPQGSKKFLVQWISSEVWSKWNSILSPSLSFYECTGWYFYKSICVRSDPLASGYCFRLGVLVTHSDGIHIVCVFFGLPCGVVSLYLPLPFYRPVGGRENSVPFSGVSMGTIFRPNVCFCGTLTTSFSSKKKKKVTWAFNSKQISTQKRDWNSGI